METSRKLPETHGIKSWGSWVSFHKHFKTLTTIILMDAACCFSLGLLTSTGGMVWPLPGHTQQQWADKEGISYMSMPRITTLPEQAGSRQMPTYPATSINSLWWGNNFTCVMGSCWGLCLFLSKDNPHALCMINLFAVKSNTNILTCVERNECVASKNYGFTSGKVSLST